MVNAPDTRPEAPLRQSNCLGRTCMKWRENGELSDLDVQLILQRLIAVDAQAAGLRDWAAGATAVRAHGVG